VKRDFTTPACTLFILPIIYKSGKRASLTIKYGRSKIKYYFNENKDGFLKNNRRRS